MPYKINPSTPDSPNIQPLSQTNNQYLELSRFDERAIKLIEVAVSDWRLRLKVIVPHRRLVQHDKKGRILKVV
jgi:hypothetical protein